MYDWRLPSLERAIAYGRERELPLNQLGHLEHFHYGGERACREWADGLDVKPSDVVVDVGSGVGGTVRWFDREIGCSTVGVEIRSDFVQTSRDWGGSYIEGDGASVSLPPHDVTLMILSLGHMSRDAIKNAARFNRTGRFVIETIVDDETSLNELQQDVLSAGWSPNTIDLTSIWSEWTIARRDRFADRRELFTELYGTDRYDERLTFYRDVADVFMSGVIGVRISSVPIPCGFDIDGSNIIEFDRALE